MLPSMSLFESLVNSNEYKTEDSPLYIELGLRALLIQMSTKLGNSGTGSSNSLRALLIQMSTKPSDTFLSPSTCLRALLIQMSTKLERNEKRKRFV